MSAHLDHLLASARDGAPTWDTERSERVLSGAVRTRESRAIRHRAARRVLVVASGATLLVLALLRTAGGSSTGASADVATPSQALEPIAANAQGDGGFARD